MKKILVGLVALLVSLFANAQKDVTKFLGIPVDGTKSEMVQKLKAKGFRPVSGYDDMLEGEFNGSNVYITISTNRNKVWSIIVAYYHTNDERLFLTKFNRLCDQFNNNSKYITIEYLTMKTYHMK